MTLPANPSLFQIADEFGLPRSTPFPSGFYGKGGAATSGALSLADFGGRSNFSAEFTIGAQTINKLGSTGRSRYQRTLTAAPSGGSGSFSYMWVIKTQTGAIDMVLTSPATATPLVSASWADDGSEGAGASGSIELTITDTSNNQARVVAHNVGLG